MKTIKKLTQQEAYKVLKLVEANGKLENGYWVYNDGWSDLRVSQEVGLHEQTVRDRRRHVFGDMQRGAHLKEFRIEGRKRIDQMETEVRTLRVANYQLARRVENLEKALNVFISAGEQSSVPRDKLEELRTHFNGLVTPTPEMK